MENSELKALEAIVIRASRGDRLAQSHLIEVTQKSLMHFCLHLCGRRELAEDICQETYVKSLSRLKELKVPSSFKSWLFQTAKNIYFDFLKSPQNKARQNVDDLQLIGQDADKDVAREVIRTLEVLSPEDRLLLILIDLQGYSYTEAAQLCSLPETNIPSKLHRIRLKFMENYKK